eukprot:CAMPEP_0179406256 /NCGR_PEP_ID=MMETSP0799-20121207/780_1 /TAXON_ID=46947 /ORGANISM="Geminigera cryophila, Strain CCMP2564" /LENGTH=213 /DNA_ID=CAMNT_0021177273 /DNA_START=511 /DNA_END=1149 /DNA_ORIENTATION=+
MALLWMSAYCIRVAETPVNQYHSTEFWNQLWLVTVTMTTVGYGDSVPQTHFGRFVCVWVMIGGAILLSLMTASATGFLILDKREQLICNHSEWSNRRQNVTCAVVKYLQYIWRINKAQIQENWVLRNELRRDFWKSLLSYRSAEHDWAEMNGVMGNPGMRVEATNTSRDHHKEEMHKIQSHKPDHEDSSGIKYLTMKNKFKATSFRKDEPLRW